ncbi:MAG: DNA-directed RNA polymerase subunit beta' [Chloroflexota bacterium]|nr:DNA-directed RNA polymerase subunit beta' [Chloroflexota bacterium]
MQVKEFNALRLSLASPEEILSWSYGEVTKPETINYRRLRPEKDGLFCEAIFGPTKDYQCYCGKYKGVRFKGIVCDKCGVEVTRSYVRRERMGHIELAAPVAHIWYTWRVPSYLGSLLNISRRDLDRVLYFAQYVIIKVDEEARQRALQRLEEEYELERARLGTETQEQIEELKGTLEAKIEKLEGKKEVVHQRLEEELTSATEEIMEEAKALQGRLEGLMGRPADASLSFSPNETSIVQTGEVVTADHLKFLNKVIQERLSQVKAKVEEERKDEKALIEAEVDSLRYASDQEIEELRKKLLHEVGALRTKIEADRQELEELALLQFINESRYRELKSKWGNVFRAGMGAEAFYEIVKGLDLDAMAKELWREIRTSGSKQRRKKATKRLRVVEAFHKSGNRPEWMFLKVLPVIPPDLRPMVQLDGGRFATSDLNDLYRRVINRNNRLKRLLKLQAPEVIIRNEKRMLQEAVDSLIDNSRRGKAISRRGRRELKSLSDILKGKQGRFRRNLLGKRVDYSGRSVIVIGPHLKLHQCGLPREMALELYKPFVISKLVKYNYASNIKSAKRILERKRPEVWEVLEEAIKERPVLLNRAPTLHRLSIQAFEPVLVEGQAIQVHPLICAAFNADFDGDQMAVHVPLSKEAVKEARELMLSIKNPFKPANGKPIAGPTKDMVLGCYYLTMEREGCRGEGRVFANLDEIALAYNLGKVALHAKINLRWPADKRRRQKIIETTVGRAIFNRALPDELRFVNEVLDKDKLRDLVARCYQRLSLEKAAEVLDRIKALGFKFATHSGITVAVSDLVVPEAKEKILKRASENVDQVKRQYRRGLLTDDEQYSKVVEIWTKATNEVTEAVARHLEPYGPIRVMAASGATKGGFQPIRQLAGMRGLMADPSGRIIPMPIRSNFREGLSAMEYFISTHGARKGLADTALRTADAGYLTRRLVDVAQDVIINTEDCGTRAGIWISKSDDVGGQTLRERILGRIAAKPVADPRTGEVIIDRNEVIEEEQVEAMEKAGIEKVYVRSPLTCELRHGICAKCYGRDLGRGEMVKVGTAVGIIAAQSIGEPGTQLTLRTFHTGGVVGALDITHGLPRVVELFESRKHPKGEAILSDIGGVVEIHREGEWRHLRVVDKEIFQDEYDVGGWKILVEDGDEIADGTPIASWHGEKKKVAKKGGRVLREGRHIVVTYEKLHERRYDIPSAVPLEMEDGQIVRAGQRLTAGVKNPLHLLRIVGRERTRLYLLSEIQKVYCSQGVNINDKHFEIIIRKMMEKVRVASSGDSEFLPGDLVNRLEFAKANAEIAAEGGQPATAHQVLLSITKAALNAESCLAAASFQHTIGVLAEAVIAGRRDELRGLKENVILGKLIPAGTGFDARKAKPLAEEELASTPEAEASP